jgi:hypothetical protein
MKDFIFRVQKWIIRKNLEIRERSRGFPDAAVIFGMIIIFSIFFLISPSLSIILGIMLFTYLLYLEGASFIVAVYTSAHAFFHGTVVVVAFLAVASLIFTFDDSRFFEIDHTIDELNKKSEYIEAVKMADSFIKVKDDDCKSYKIKLRRDKRIYEQPFDLMRYTRQRTDIETKDKIEWGKLCKALEDGNNGIPTSILVKDIEDEKTISALANLFAELKRSTGKISVYIKGYADSQTEFWQRKLEKNSEYLDIKYYKADDFFKNSYVIDDANLLVHSVPGESLLVKQGYYGNADLPFLRAKYVFENYFKGYLQECLGSDASGGILEGVVLDGKGADVRNTEVYVTLCMEEHSFPGCSAK